MQNAITLPAPRTATLAMQRAGKALDALPTNATTSQALAAAGAAARSAARTHWAALAKGAAPALAAVALARYRATGSTLAPAPKRGA